mmetsp:Transcript_23091/g.38690  ORF Transcript_23091/g.38690 Transcript_23091/m.38690 type:complete len:374 (+) Transcript_23091:1269-2390(+)
MGMGTYGRRGEGGVASRRGDMSCWRAIYEVAVKSRGSRGEEKVDALSEGDEDEVAFAMLVERDEEGSDGGRLDEGLGLVKRFGRGSGGTRSGNDSDRGGRRMFKCCCGEGEGLLERRPNAEASSEGEVMRPGGGACTGVGVELRAEVGGVVVGLLLSPRGTCCNSRLTNDVNMFMAVPAPPPKLSRALDGAARLSSEEGGVAECDSSRAASNAMSRRGTRGERVTCTMVGLALVAIAAAPVISSLYVSEDDCAMPLEGKATGGTGTGTGAGAGAGGDIVSKFGREGAGAAGAGAGAAAGGGGGSRVVRDTDGGRDKDKDIGEDKVEVEVDEKGDGDGNGVRWEAEVEAPVRSGKTAASKGTLFWTEKSSGPLE